MTPVPTNFWGEIRSLGVPGIVAALFFAGAMTNFFGDPFDPVEGTAGLAISAAVIGLALWFRGQRRMDEAFAEWLSRNSQAVLGSGAEYRGFRMTGQTVVTRYQAAYSVLIVTFKVPSRLYIVGGDAGWNVAAIFTASTFVFGWWGIPWGPIKTIQSIVENARGGKRSTIEALLAPTGVTGSLKATEGARAHRQ